MCRGLALGIEQEGDQKHKYVFNIFKFRSFSFVWRIFRIARVSMIILPFLSEFLFLKVMNLFVA